MKYVATKQEVDDRGTPPDAFLDALVDWGKTAPDEIFNANNERDIYSSVFPQLGPWKGPAHRRAVILEVLRVLAGFESSWNWEEGRDTHNPDSVTDNTTEAGAWQVSADSMNFGKDLKELVWKQTNSLNGRDFQSLMKTQHSIAIEYIARLLRHTTQHNGPVKRGEIHPWLRRDAVAEFMQLLEGTPPSNLAAVSPI